MKKLFLGLAERLMRCPTAPYHEGLVAAEAAAICREHRLFFEFDPFGNLLVRAASEITDRPIVLAAHMDHPGFTLRSRKVNGQFVGRFDGGVGDSYFRSGTNLLLMPGRTPATLGRRISPSRRDFEIHTTRLNPAHPDFAIWDLPEFKRAGDSIHGRVCDDLIGVATILTVLISLRRSKSAAQILGVLSRAEEVGFHGALALAQSKRIPPQALIISLETSRELSPAKMGAGVIIRVGDRASIFDSTATRFLTELATDLKKRRPKFKFQRALMSGGTCEATAYQEYGYLCAALCVALGNYHNCAEKNEIDAEFVSLSDALSMATFLCEVAAQWPRMKKFTERLPKRLAALATQARRELIRRKLPEL